MTPTISVYLEGGGDQKDTRTRLRKAFGVFLQELRQRGKAVRLKIVPCGSGTSAFDDFKTALTQEPEAFNVLLVDSEGPVLDKSPWRHLAQRPENRCPNPGVDDRHCHLMVQTMEAWLIADREKLAEYYGRNFHETALPDNPNVEQIDKDLLTRALCNATRNTKKGEYHKTRHAPEILQRIRPAEVRAKAVHCERLFQTLLAQIDNAQP